jgi:hypothetical protein
MSSDAEHDAAVNALMRGFDPTRYLAANDAGRMGMIRNLFPLTGRVYGVGQKEVEAALTGIALGRTAEMAPAEIVRDVMLKVGDEKHGKVETKGRLSVSTHTEATLAAAAAMRKLYVDTYPENARTDPAQQIER